MPRNVSDVYSVLPGSVAVTGQPIDSSDYNDQNSDFANALNDVAMLSGSKPFTGNQSMGSHKLTSVTDGTAAQDAATTKQVQNSVVQHSTAVGGTADAIQVTFSPASTSLTTNEVIRWKSGGANTIVAPTLSKDAGSTNKTIKKGAGAALEVGDTGASGYECEAIYNGTDWILKNPATSSALDADLVTIGSLTATTNNILQSVSSAWASRTPTQVTATLDAVVGDSGSGGTKGLVPAPASGDAAANKYLKANGAWATISAPTIIVKQTADTRGNTTLTNDSDFTFSMLANTKYLIRGQYSATTASSGSGARIGLSGPASPTKIRFMAMAAATTATMTVNSAIVAPFNSTSSSARFDIITATAAGTMTVDFTIVWENGANAGTFVLQTADDNNSNNVTFNVDSWMTYQVAN